MQHVSIQAPLHQPRQPMPSPVAAMKPLIEGRYAIEKKLADGGLGEVFLARDTHVGDKVVLKFIGEEWLNDHTRIDLFVRLLLIEAEALSSIYHPGVPSLRSVSQSGNFLAMEYIKGKTLEDESLAPDQVFELAMGLSDVLGSVHASGVLHRDIKPANILIMDNMYPIVVDFGCAKLSSCNYREVYLDWPVGTPDFASPEAIRGGNYTDERSDLYSLAAVLYTKFADSTPFRIDPYLPPETAVKIRKQTPYTPLGQAAPNLRRSVCEVIDKAMAENPGDRYDSVGHLRVALASAWA